ncbi:hypothetical protein WICMUC_003878 [Wickerhamomyces mucosus]|uniref:Uncharacterized protein n=1 Tax=Wickerhamomyces mucosus TaxID=1378264 RepID=A0A9P8PKR8_9ASCO|nr:hypothetical protein WICMUC_003878 [Wickerhamomyces mucosus]
MAAFFAPIESYDFHIYYYANYPPSRLEAIQLKNKIFEDFAEEIEKDDLFIKVLRDETVTGPHIVAYFEVDISDPASFLKFFSWAQLNHGSLSILVHPNSGNPFKDHTINAAWIGEKLPLKNPEDLKAYIGKSPVPWGYPNRQDIKDGFYDKPELYLKRPVYRLLRKGPIDEFWSRELIDSYKELLKDYKSE